MRISFDSGRPRSLAARIFGALLGVILFGAALMFSVLLFAFLALCALVFWAGFWWKTRALRREIRESYAGSRKNLVIEGEAVRTKDT